jgi:hypothetical protein
MFQRLIEDIKHSTGNALRMTYLATAAAVALFVTTSFLCAAALVTLVAAGSYMERKRRVKVRAAETAKSAMHSALADPMLVAAGIQIVRAIGIKKLIPIIAIGGVALGLFAASRRDAPDQTPAE